ncbi:hypothetical protein FRAHR75_90043 [Frankia sp. Hr75.2]|nr:hypothetical protein FRAHR75_90043 [Frankia sp. Hr75.2]
MGVPSRFLLLWRRKFLARKGMGRGLVPFFGLYSYLCRDAHRRVPQMICDARHIRGNPYRSQPIHQRPVTDQPMWRRLFFSKRPGSQG